MEQIVVLAVLIFMVARPDYRKSFAGDGSDF